MKLTTNFSLSEFKSKDGKDFPFDVLNNIKFLASQLQIIRDELKKPISVTSGYRSEEHNKKVGGAKNSYHVKGMAVDIKVEGMTPIEVEKAIEKMMMEGKIMRGGIGLYKTWVHYDFRGKLVKWNG